MKIESLAVFSMPKRRAIALQGLPRLILRLEALTVLGAAVFGYRCIGGSWTHFGALFLLPDLSMLAYFWGSRVGALAYNVTHSYVSAAILAGIGLLIASPAYTAVALIWTAHIGFDRALGYGLKYASDFKDTHLGQLGRARQIA